MKLTNRDKTLIYSELAKMVKAGFGFDRSADLLLEQASTPVQRNFALTLQKGLRQGAKISTSLEQTALGITELEVGVIRAAEESGSLEEGFSYLHDYFLSVDRTNRQIRSGLVYPFVLLHLAVILPALPTLIMGGGFDAVVRQVLINFAILYASVGLLWLAGSILSHQAQSQVGADKLLGMIPLVGRARRLISWQRFCGVFGMGIRSGRRISSSLDAAAKAIPTAQISHATMQLAEIARSGNPVGPSMVKQRAFPKDLANSVVTAEASGTLDEDLRRWAAYYEDAVRSQMEKVGSLVPRFVYMLVVIFVAWQIIAFYSDYLNGVMDIWNENIP